MIINFLGDSITQGAGAARPGEEYVEVVGQILGCTVRNYGLGGTRIARQTTPSAEPIYDRDFLMRSKEMIDDADLVFVFGGTNDYGHGDAEIGDLDSENIYTFCGALNTLVKDLVARYGKDKLCFIRPLHRYNETNPYGEGNKSKAGPVLQEYVDALNAIVTKNGIDMLTFEEEFPVPTTNTGDELTVDGLHPTSKGHRIIAEKICAYVRSKQA